MKTAPTPTAGTKNCHPREVDSHLLLLVKPRGLLLQNDQLVLGQRQLLARVVQLPSQLVVVLLQFHVFHLGDVLLTVELLVLLLQLGSADRS